MRISCVFLFLLWLTASIGLGQGTLNPSGTPAPTMKRLDEVEPRALIGAINTPGDTNNTFVISQPGSYYLGAPLPGTAGKNGILIKSDNVSIDLRGFSIVCPVAGVNALVGVLDSGGHRNLTVANGIVRGWGTANISFNSNTNNVELNRLHLSDGAGNGGTDFSGDGFNGRSCANARIIDCTASNNAGDGFATSNNSVVTGCISSGNSVSGFSGISTTYTNCAVNGNFGPGYFLAAGCVVTNCTANSTQSTGFSCVGTPVIATGCQANANKLNGFDLNIGCLVSNCVASGNLGIGFNYVGGNLLIGNLATGNSGDGFHGTGSNNRIEGNHAVANTGAGIHPSSGVADFVLRNTSYANNPNYSPASGSYIGPTTTTPSTATSAWANF